MSSSITSANSVIMLSIDGLFPVPQQLQGYAADDIFDTESVSPAETVMGLDGILSAGWVPIPIKQSFTIMADSLSVPMFEAWYAAQQAVREIYRCQAVIVLTSLHVAYTLNNGVLTAYPAMSDAKKVMQPRKFGITWESVQPSVV